MKTMDVATLRTWLAEGRAVTVLDVRTDADYAEWRIPASVHVNAYGALKADDASALAGLDLPRDRPVVAVCGAGQISLRAAAQLAACGYDTYSLAGGMQAWSLAWNTATLPPLPSGATVVQVRRTGKGCLSYLIGANRQAVVVDAALDPSVYQELAAAHDWQIAAVLETHVHADHVSRARALATATGATLYVPASDRLAFPCAAVQDGASIPLGPALLRAIHTPGHTWESTSYVLDDQVLFTGDTLFLATVGRPDLEAAPGEARQRATALYGSLQRLLTLPPTTLVAPGHTSAPVAFDGQPLVAPLATVVAAIPRLQLPEAVFVESVLAALPPTPPNHHQIVARNEAGLPVPADVTTLEAGANRCALA